MTLTQDNYYSAEANKAYWSASFVKSMLHCQAETMAELNGEYIRPDNTALMVGSYVDAYFSGETDSFISEHPEIFNSRTGEIKAEYRKANDMIDKAVSDELFMEYMQGDKQTILTGNIDGIPFKAKLDVYISGKRIVDLKTTKDMEPMWKSEQGKVSFVDYWNWSLQMAIYQHLEGNHLPCYLAVITKEEPPNIEIIEIPQHVLDAEMEILRTKLPYLDAVRQGVIEPERCERCTYCRKTKKLTKVVSLDELNQL